MSMDYLQAIIDCAGDPVFVKDGEHKFVFVNNAACEMFGIPREQWLGKTDHQLFPKEQADVFRMRDGRVLETGEKAVNEEQISDSRGNGRTIVATRALYADKAGEKYIIGAIRDITEQKKAEEALLESELKYRTLIEASLAGVYIVQDGLFRFVNKQWCEIYGYAYEEVVDKLCPMDLAHPDDRHIIRKDETRLGVGSDYAASTHRCIRKDGDVIIVHVLGSPMIHRGRAASSGTVYDVTEQKKAEEELRQKTALLEAQVNASPDGIIVVDAGRKVLQNRRVNDLLKIPSHIAESDDDEAQVEWVKSQVKNPEQFRDRIAYLVAHPYENLRDELELEDGTVLERYCGPVIGKDGKRYGGIVILRDITQRRRAEEALRASRLQLSEAMNLAKIVYWEADLVTKEFIFNDPFYALYGASAEQEGGYRMPVQEYATRFVHPDDLPLFHQALERSAATPGPAFVIDTEHRIIRRDGEVRHILARSRIVKDDSGRTVEIHGTNQDITERKKMQEAVLESEEKFRLLFERSADPTLFLYEGKFIDWNEAAARDLGCLSGDDIIGIGPVDISPERQPDGRLSSEKVRELIDETLRNGVNRFEWVHRNSSGEDRWIDVSLTVIPIHGRKIIYTVWRDISERKRAEDGLKQAEAKYRAIFENATMGIFQTTLEGRAVNANPAHARILGFDSPQELMDFATQRSVERYVNPQDRARMTELCLKHGFVEGFEAELYRRDGSEIWVSMNVRAVKDAEGNVVCFEGAMEDITARRQAENALRKSEQRFRSLVETTSDWVWEVDPDGVFTYASPKVRDILGYGPEEVIGKRPFDFTDQYEAERVAALFNNIVQLRKPFSGLENASIRKDGRKAVLETSGVPVFDNDGAFLGFRGINRDVTERKHLESQLQQSQKMEAIGTLAGGIAHDFNNILMALVGYAALLRMKIGDTTLYSYVDEILAASQKATDLVQSLLAFSKQQAIRLESVSLQGIIEGTEKLLKRLVTEDIAIKTFLAPENITIMADKTQIDQILFNLATNARDAMPQGGTFTIETSVVELDDEFRRFHGYGKPGRYALLSVSDTGTGMDRATQRRIFDPFFTTKEVGKGTGLGLSTVYGIVKQHNGYIAVYSEPGSGTTFHIYLPTVDEIGREEEPARLAVKRGCETILVAEDSEELRGLISRILTEYGYTTVEAVDGTDAVEQFEKADKIDLLIFDSVMPKKNGREAYNEICRIKPGVKVIFTSGYTRDVFLDKGVEDGKFNFLQKPISPDALLQKVRQTLDDGQAS